MAHTHSPIHVLVIEDQSEDYQYLARLLRKSMSPVYKTFQCETLALGMQYLDQPDEARGHKIDVVLLDLGLPDCNPKDTAANFQHYATRFPTVVLTGHDPSEENGYGIDAIEYGAEDFLYKGELKISNLHRAIRHAIQRKTLKRSLEEAQELAKVGSWQLDLQSNAMKCSPFTTALFELERGESLQSLKHYMSRVHPDDQQLIAEALHKAFTLTREMNEDHRILTPNNEIKYLSIKGVVETNAQGVPVSIKGTLQDITDRKLVEILQQEKELAQKATRMRQDFLARTSHEIRTPLNPILLLTDMLSKTPLNAEQQEYVDVIHNAGETLLALVNDILDLAKIEAGKISFTQQQFSVERVFSSIFDMMDLKAKEKGLILKFQPAPHLNQAIMGDSVRLLQILLNLVGNAIKFTHSGTIQIACEQLKESSREVWMQFSVKDTGIGIPKDQLKSIFDSFQQVGKPTHSEQGVGLGLSIVRQLVHLQGGTISVSSEPGQGSTFSFELPFGKATHPEPTPAMTHTPSQKLDLNQVVGMRILLVEDNPLNQMVTNKLLTDWGVEVSIANNGVEAIEQLESRPFDLILMDIQMPEMDGYEATRYIRNEMPSPVCHIPIIALTANVFTGSDDECLQVGMNDYLSKPIEIRNLFDKLVSHVVPQSPTPGGYKAPYSGSYGNGNSNGTSMKAVVQHTATVYHTPLPLTQLNSGYMSSYQYINLDKLHEMVQDHDTIRNTVKLFLVQAPELIETMQSMLLQRNYTKLWEAAHRLKSTSGYMGIMPLNVLCESIISVAKNTPHSGELGLMVQEAEALLNQALPELETAAREI